MLDTAVTARRDSAENSADGYALAVLYGRAAEVQIPINPAVVALYIDPQARALRGLSRTPAAIDDAQHAARRSGEGFAAGSGTGSGTGSGSTAATCSYMGSSMGSGVVEEGSEWLHPMDSNEKKPRPAMVWRVMWCMRSR